MFLRLHLRLPPNPSLLPSENRRQLSSTAVPTSSLFTTAYLHIITRRALNSSPCHLPDSRINLFGHNGFEQPLACSVYICLLFFFLFQQQSLYTCGALQMCVCLYEGRGHNLSKKENKRGKVKSFDGGRGAKDRLGSRNGEAERRPTFTGCLISSAAIVWSFWTVCRCLTVAVKLLFEVAKGKRSKRRIKGTLTSRNRWKEFARIADPGANLWVCFAWRHIVCSAVAMASNLQQEPVAFQALLHRRLCRVPLSVLKH